MTHGFRVKCGAFFAIVELGHVEFIVMATPEQDTPSNVIRGTARGVGDRSDRGARQEQHVVRDVEDALTVRALSNLVSG